MFVNILPNKALERFLDKTHQHAAYYTAFLNLEYYLAEMNTIITEDLRK